MEQEPIEVQPTEPVIAPPPTRDVSAIRWAIGTCLALPLIIPLWLAVTFHLWGIAADAWSGLRISLGF